MNAQSKNTRLQVVVTFPACGAEFHPAFSDAIQTEDGKLTNTFIIKYPLHIKGILTSRAVQLDWADRKIRHIRSWGKSAYMTETQIPRK